MDDMKTGGGPRKIVFGKLGRIKVVGVGSCLMMRQAVCELDHSVRREVGMIVGQGTDRHDLTYRVVRGSGVLGAGFQSAGEARDFAVGAFGG